MIRTLTEQVYFKTCNNFGTAIVDGGFPASGSYIEVGQYERFGFLVRAGALDSALTCQVQQAAAIDDTPVDVAGAVVTVGTGDDNELFLIEVETRKLDLNNGYNYVTLDVAGATGGNDYLDIVFVGINPLTMPVTQPAGTNTPVIVAG